MEGIYENGVSYFPAVITVDNPDGTMMSGSYVTYRLVASQSDDCLLLPIQCVKYVDMGGQTGTVVFLKAPSRPENAVDLESVEVPDGFYAVPVTVGISTPPMWRSRKVCRRETKSSPVSVPVRIHVGW
jgi:multidrug efflux pump subunit AcrA (membrane-fusion protein)